jgi:hypothetical protein
VLRFKQSNKGRHKLTPPWEGPFIVAEVLKPGTYKLANEKGEVFTNAWNIEHLRRFYPYALKLCIHSYLESNKEMFFTYRTFEDRSKPASRVESVFSLPDSQSEARPCP